MSLAKLFRPKPHNKLEVSWQNWVTFALEVDPEHPKFQTLVTAESPLLLVLDLQSSDFNDEFIVIEEVGIERDGTLSFDRVGWYKFKKVKPESSMPPVIGVTSPEGKGFVASESIIVLSPTSGPWTARVKIAQISGMQKQLRYLSSDSSLDGSMI